MRVVTPDIAPSPTGINENYAPRLAACDELLTVVLAKPDVLCNPKISRRRSRTVSAADPSDNYCVDDVGEFARYDFDMGGVAVGVVMFLLFRVW